MAGERKGKTYEAVTCLALRRLRAAGHPSLRGEIRWNVTPEGMSIEPDFLLGEDPNAPDSVVLIAHSGSAKNSDMKFWRNMGELVEEKTCLPTIPRVYSIAFDSVIKEDLKSLQAQVFDGQLIVGDRPYGEALRKWVDANHGELPKGGEEKTAAVESRVDADAELARLLDLLSEDIAGLLRKSRPDLDRQLWERERVRPRGKAPESRKTFLRRGVGKLLILDRPDLVDSTGRLGKSASRELVAALKTMGLASDAIGGPRVTDPEMLWAVRSLAPEELKALHATRSTARVAEWIESLRGLAGVQDQLAYLASHWCELTTGEGFHRHLVLCHRAPHKLCPTAVPMNSRRVWLYHLVVEWVKLADGTRTDFGVAALIAELRHLRSNRDHRGTVRGILGREGKWRSEETVRLGLQDWQSAGSGQKFALKDDDLARVADALARRLRVTRPPLPVQDAKRMTDALVQTVLEAKLLTYRGFKPFEILLERELGKAGLKGTIEVAVRACFAEAASAAGATLDPRSSGTTVMRVGNTIVNWQSCSDAGRDHKKKELCGRAVALRYHWDAERREFVPRPGVTKMVLLLDGTWRQKDIDALVHAGWDEIYYPDEMGKLAATIE